MQNEPKIIAHPATVKLNSCDVATDLSESARNITDMVNELAVSHGLEPITKQFNTVTI